jgi:TolB protein
MRMEFNLQDKALRLRLIDNGPENLVLFSEVLPLNKRVPETVVMKLVNRLSERISGEPGLLGSAIAFVLRQPGYAKVIVATDTHSSKLKLISHNSGINLLPKWSPSGLSMVYTVLGDRGTQVYFHSFASNGSPNGGSRYLTKVGALNTGGSFSPDGKQLVLTMSDRNNADLFKVDLEKNSRFKLTSRSGIETQAHWARDGSKIVFVSDRSGTPQVYLLEVDTREDLRITFDGVYNADPKWSPDSRMILFTKRVNGHDQIHIMDQYGENIRPVTRGRYDAEQPEWSPDGRQIVFTSNRTGDFKLYVVSTDGSNLRRVTRTPSGFEETSPSWTRRKLAP